MTKKHHPQNRYERRLLDKKKKIKPLIKDHDDGIRRKNDATQERSNDYEEVH